MATESNKNRVAFEFNPFVRTGKRVKSGDRSEALSAVADFVKESVLSSVAKGRSPVQNGKWKRGLTKGYKKIKSKESGVRFANLELSGDTLDQFDVRIEGNKIIAAVEGDRAGVADGNNRGTYGKTRGSKAKAREWIPKKRQTFKKSIWDGVKSILKDFNGNSGNNK